MRTRLCLAFVFILLAAPFALSRSRTDDSWLWKPSGSIIDPNCDSGSEWGYTLALDGATTLIGSPGSWGGATGVVYALETPTSNWISLRPPDLAAGARFGCSLAFQGDTALIGASDDDDAGVHSGSAYVFVRSGSSWNKMAKLVPTGSSADDQFGYSVALDGNLALIGAPYDDTAAGQDAGSAYVYTGSGASWSLMQKLEASDGATLQSFGRSVSLSGATALIGADKGSGATSLSGAAYVFTLRDGSWSEEDKLFAADGSNGDHFGRVLELEGNRALVGAPNCDDAGANSGAAYVFDRSGSTWTQTQKLFASDAATKDMFGWDVALEGDTAMISAPDDPYQYPGGIYVFHRQGSSWSEVQKLPEPDDIGYFGACIALRGNRVLVSDPLFLFPTIHIYSRPPETGIGMCYGDPGSGTPCPCGNDNDGSIPGSGCDNGVHSSGAQLTGYGKPNISDDEVFLRATHAEPNNSGLFFQGSLRVNGGAGVPFGDGLRCAGGQVVRLQVTFADETGTSMTSIPIAAKGGVSPGDFRWYQYWYRTTVDPPCGPGINDFNTSNSILIVWQP